MTPLEQFIPHREEPMRRCFTCQCILSSANTTNACWEHGGWTEWATWREQSDAFSELMEEVV